MTGGPVREILVDALPGDTRVVLIADDRAVEIRLARGDPRGRVGAVHLGRVLGFGVGAAFVDIACARPGLLDRRPGAAALTEGAAVLVQIDKAPIDDKGAGLTADVTLPGHRLIYTPLKPGIAISRRLGDAAARDRVAAAMAAIACADEGFILRRAAAAADRAALEDEAARLRADWRALIKCRDKARPPALLHQAPSPLERALFDHGDAVRRVVIDDPRALAAAKRWCARLMPVLVPRLGHGDGPEGGFERDRVDAAIEAALARRVVLADGGTLVVEPGETLTAIDVNPRPPAAGGAVGRRRLEANIEAVPEIAHQIRLRNLAGLVVVDFPRMRPRRDRTRLVAALRHALADDPMACDVLGMTAGGLIEIVRRRGEPPLDRALQGPCATCHGGGRLADPATVAFTALRAARRAGDRTPAQPLALVVAPAVAVALDQGAADARAAVEAGLGRPLEIRPDPAAPADRFELVPA